MLPTVNLIDTSSGRFLLFATQDQISQNLYFTGRWEPVTIAVAQHLLETPEQGIIVDAGANLGAFAIPLARRLPQGLSVHCFEIQRIVFYQLCGNVILNGFENIFPHNVGLGAESGDIDLPTIDYTKEKNIGGLSASAEVRSLRQTHTTDLGSGPFDRVSVRTLDSFDYRNVRLLKIDVEGMELDVIKGAARTLEKSGFPPILFEAWKTANAPALSGHVDAVLGHVGALGYAIQRIGDLCIAQFKGRRFLKVSAAPEANAISLAWGEP